MPCGAAWKLEVWHEFMISKICRNTFICTHVYECMYLYLYIYVYSCMYSPALSTRKSRSKVIPVAMTTLTPRSWPSPTKRNQGSLEKWLITRQMQGRYKMYLKYHEMPKQGENDQTNGRRHVKRAPIGHI